MRSEWKRVTLDQALHINPKVPMIKGKEYPFVEMSSVEANNKNVKAKEIRNFKGSGSRFVDGDILMARITPCLQNGKISKYKTCTEEKHAHGSTEFIVLRHRENISHKEFVYYLTISDQVKPYAISQMNGSSGRQRVPVDSFKHLEINLPPLPEQKAITDILCALDDKIELNQKMCKTLEDIASALFKNWFIDFDPVKAKSEGRMPESLSPEIAKLFPERFAESPIGKIPQGWDLMKLGKISEIHNGFAFKSQDYRENGIYILRTKNFSNDGYATRLKDDVFLNVELANDYKKYLCQAFDYHLVMVGNSVGKTAYILPHMLPALRNQNMWCFRPKSKSQSRFYLNQAVEYKVKSVIGWASGSARSFFRKSDFQSYDILWPPEEIQAVFEEITSSIYKELSSLYKQNIGLSQTRDTLLPKLISGKLKLKITEEYCVS